MDSARLGRGWQKRAGGASPLTKLPMEPQGLLGCFEGTQIKLLHYGCIVNNRVFLFW